MHPINKIRLRRVYVFFFHAKSTICNLPQIVFFEWKLNRGFHRTFSKKWFSAFEQKCSASHWAIFPACLSKSMESHKWYFSQAVARNGRCTRNKNSSWFKIRSAVLQQHLNISMFHNYQAGSVRQTAFVYVYMVQRYNL